MKKITCHSVKTILFILYTTISAWNNNCQAADVTKQFIQTAKPKIVLESDLNSISLKADGLTGFSNCKPYLAWRNDGKKEWIEDISRGIKKEQIAENEIKITCSVGPVVANIKIKKLDDNVLELSGSLTNKSRKIIELDRFHYLHGIIDDHNTKFISYEKFSVAKSTDTIAPLNVTFGKNMKSSHANFPVLADPIHDVKNWSSSLDAGIFASAASGPGWFMAASGPCTAYGEIGFKTQVTPSKFYAGVLLDNIILEPDSSRILEKIIVYAGDWQEGMDYWIKKTAKEMNLKPQDHPLVGYCSWYQKYGNILPADILQANEEFKAMPIPPGGRTIQIDAGFQVMPGNWLPNKKFERDWKDFSSKIAETGSIPGLWLSPTAIYETHPIVREHPEMLQQFPENIEPLWFSSPGWAPGSGWEFGKPGTRTFFMDIDRPDSKEFIRNIMKDAIHEGWRYFKIDYTYSLSNARVAWDRKKTIFESKRDLFKLIKETCGPDILINACLGFPERFVLGYAEIARVSLDIGSRWHTVQRNLKELLLRSKSNGYWWQVDPDVFYMRTEKTSLNNEENFLLTGTIGLIGGAFLTSDLPSQWSADAKKTVDTFWTKEGPRVPSHSYVLYDDHDKIKAYLVSYFEPHGRLKHRVGIYNLNDKNETIQIPLKDLKLNPWLPWSIEAVSLEQSTKYKNDTIVIENQPPHSLRIINLSVKD
ncbi:MAG: hypothetical protein M0Q53_11615 [Prolixibacteraceae bacterium]|jgi:hypothetical protein|nr:hypothetical protein [Prolixibacteraceae bacterium]